MDGGAWWAAVYGVAQSRTQLKQLSSSSSNACTLVCLWLIVCLMVLARLSLQKQSKSTNVH